MTTLYPVKEFRLPIIAECISPDVFHGKRRTEIEDSQVWEGNRQRRLVELFKVEEDKADELSASPRIVIEGDVSRVRRIGARMRTGEIFINGDVGMHLGEKMHGGRITVKGSASGWAGSVMKGGSIEIYGNAGDYLAAPQRGSTRGMNGGKIVVHGSVGNEAGAHMKKGIITVHGCAGQFAGFRMHGGLIYIKGDCDGRAGACMVNGKIVVAGHLESVLPTFSIDGVRGKVKIEEGETTEGSFYVFVGDLSENGDGKLYVLKEKNPHLVEYERFL